MAPKRYTPEQIIALLQETDWAESRMAAGDFEPPVNAPRDHIDRTRLLPQKVP